MFVPNGPVSHSFSGKVELTRSMREQMDEKLFISRQSWPFSFGYNMIKLRFFNCSLNWRANSYVSAKEKVEEEETKVLLFLQKIAALSTVKATQCFFLWTLCPSWSFSRQEKKLQFFETLFWLEQKMLSQSMEKLRFSFSRNMVTFRN